MQASPYLARTDTRASRAATALSRTGTVGNNPGPGDGAMDSDLSTILALAHTNEKEGKEGKKDKKDTLFGPSIGVSGGGPDWCSTDGKPVDGVDELTSDIVKTWITKSKEVRDELLSLPIFTVNCPVPVTFYLDLWISLFPVYLLLLLSDELSELIIRSSAVRTNHHSPGTG